MQWQCPSVCVSVRLFASAVEQQTCHVTAGTKGVPPYVSSSVTNSRHEIYDCSRALLVVSINTPHMLFVSAEFNY